MSDKLQGGVKAGSTDVTLPVVLRSTTDNTEVTGKAFGDATLSYQRTGAVRTAITAATQTVTGAHSDGGFVEIDATNQPGLYRLDVPDAAFATGVDWVVVTVKVTGAYVWHQLFELTTNVVQSQDHASAITTIDTEVGVIDGLVDTLIARLTAARAGYLDELGPTNVPADVDTLLSRLSAARAGYLDELAGANIPTDIDSLLSRLTATRAGYIDELAAANIPADIDSLVTAVTTIDGIVDAILVDTGTDIPAQLTTIDAEVGVIDGIVDAILVDTGTDIPAQITGLNDPTAVQIATEILDHDAAPHTTNGTLGAIITDIELGGRIDQMVQGIIDNIGTPVSTLAGDLATIDTEVGVIDGIVDAILVDTGTTIPAQITAQNDLSATEVENAVWDATQSSHNSPNTTGKSLQQAKEATSIETGTAQAGAAGTITLAAGANANDDFYNHTMLVIVAGTGVGQVRSIQDYVGSTKVATVTPNWVVQPSSDSEYDIIAMGETHTYEVHQPVTTTSDTQIDNIEGYVDTMEADLKTYGDANWAPSILGGTGTETVDQDYGGSEALQVQDSSGDALYCTILAYLKTDYDAGNLTTGYIKGRVIQYADGSWSNPFMLNAATYTLVIYKDGYQTGTQEVTVT